MVGRWRQRRRTLPVSERPEPGRTEGYAMTEAYQSEANEHDRGVVLDSLEA